MKINPKTVWLAGVACLVSAPALGYVGPGAGLTLVTALWGLLLALAAAVGFLVLWPIRRWRRRRRLAMESGTELEAEDASAGPGVEQRTERDVDAR